MKKFILLLFIAFFSFSFQEVHAQLKNFDKRVQQKVNRRIDQKADRTVDKALDKTEKGIDESVKGDKNKKEKDSPNTTPNAEVDKAESGSTIEAVPTTTENVKKSNSLEAYSKFDFIPGERTLFYDDLSQDGQGDFPAKWNTNGSGEIVVDRDGNKWFEMKGNSLYIPEQGKALTENYTIEFDLSTSELDSKISSQALLQIILDDNNGFKTGRNHARISLPFGQNSANSIYIRNHIDGKPGFSNNLKADIRKQMNDGTHISIAVNKKRFRLWIDERKIVDAPTLIPGGINQVKLELNGFTRDFEDYHYYISNFKISEGSMDMRSKLISEGKLVTNGILFDVNSDKIKPESYGVIKQIADALNENPGVKVKIIGHTDADGNATTNVDLSKRRAASVRQELARQFGIAESRIEIDGKGAAEPLDSNTTIEGKANNRRVEFVKL